MNEERIVLGSGTLYFSEFTDTIPADEVIETDENLFGLIQGGATIRYTPTYYIAKDDFGKVMKKIITDEEAVLTSGIMTFNATKLNALVQTGVVTETATERKIKIGGLGNFIDKRYVLHFVHEDAMDGDIRITIVGSNEGALEFAFRKDQETIINAEFKAAPSDSDGTLIIYREEIKGDPIAVTDVALDKSTLAILEDEEAVLVATIIPDGSANKVITAVSSDPTKATVTIKGTVGDHAILEVLGIAAGETTITVTTDDGSFTDACVVTVS